MPPPIRSSGDLTWLLIVLAAAGAVAVGFGSAVASAGPQPPPTNRTVAGICRGRNDDSERACRRDPSVDDVR